MLSLLIVEDNPTDEARIIKALKERSTPGYQNNYDIKTADNLKEVLKILSYTMFDVVLLDLNIKDSQGLKTFEVLFSKTSEKFIPILITTGLSDTRLALDSLERGAAGYLVKSWIYKFPTLLHLSLHSQNKLYRQKRETHKLLQEKMGVFFPTIRRCSFCQPRLGFSRFQREDTEQWGNLEEYLINYGIGITDGVCPECFKEIIHEK